MPFFPRQGMISGSARSEPGSELQQVALARAPTRALTRTGARRQNNARDRRQDVRQYGKNNYTVEIKAE